MTIYFNVMSSNERVATVEIREVTVGTHAYSITHSHNHAYKKPEHRSTIETPIEQTPLALVSAVLNDYLAYQAQSSPTP